MGVTASQVAEWQQKYGEQNVLRLETTGLDGKVAELYWVDPKVHKNRRTIYSRVLTFYAADRQLEAGEVVLNECFLGGDEIFKDKDSMEFISAAVYLGKQVGFLPVTTTPISTKSTDATQQ